MEKWLRLPVPDKVLNDHGVYARIYGKGAPIFLIHGNYGSGHVFSKLIPGLSRQFQLILPDLPMHGSGPAECEGFEDNPLVAVDYCMAILRYLDIKACHICGHSLGGMIGLLLCDSYPLGAHSLALLDSFVNIAERPAELNTGSYYFEPCDAETRAEIDAAMSYGAGVRWHKSFQMETQARKIRCPVLELQGETKSGTEAVFSAWLKEKRADYPPGWKVVRVPGSGHFIQIEQPGFVLQELTRFWNSIFR